MDLKKMLNARWLQFGTDNIKLMSDKPSKCIAYQYRSGTIQVKVNDRQDDEKDKIPCCWLIPEELTENPYGPQTLLGYYINIL